MVPLLPQVPLPPIAGVDFKRVRSMRPTEKLGKPVSSIRNNDQMYMIWHEAVRPNLDFELPLGCSHYFDVRFVVLIAKECFLSSRATLGHVVWVSGHD
jgi:hypothetical protein